MTLIATKTKILFYEMGDHFINVFGSKYIRHKTHLRRSETGSPIGPQKLAYSANRIWSWDPETDEVKFVKNRHTGIMTEVDLKEFFLVQLQAIEYKK